MSPLWSAVRVRLEKQGLKNRGRVTVPDLGSEGRLTLKNLLDRRQPVRRLDLGELEVALARLGVGDTLAAALDALGFAVSPEPALRRADRRQASEARDAARLEAGTWVEPWAGEWIDSIVRSGTLRSLTELESVGLVRDTRSVLEAIVQQGASADAPLSRVDLAAQVLGDAHRLDAGQPLHSAVTRALGLRFPAANDDIRGWEAAGVHHDLTSGPVLTWALPARGGLAPFVEAATAAGVPVHLSRLALLEHPVRVPPGTEVLVVENPRLAEAAAQRRLGRPVVSAGGSPSAAVQLLIRQLLDAGAEVSYHGDFDTPGLQLCARMVATGVTPWRMTAQDYLTAVAEADEQGVVLPPETNRPPPTPWDPGLHTAFSQHLRIIHEERLLPDLFL